MWPSIFDFAALKGRDLLYKGLVLGKPWGCQYNSVAELSLLLLPSQVPNPRIPAACPEEGGKFRRQMGVSPSVGGSWSGRVQSLLATLKWIVSAQGPQHG